MKKKQKPIILGSILVIVVIAVVVTNTTDLWARLGAPKQPDAPEQGVAKTLTDQQKAGLAAQVAGASGAPRVRRSMPTDEDPENRPTTIPEEPTILIKKQTYQKQYQSESGVNSQWYDKTSNTSNQVAEMAKKRGN